MNEKIRSFIEFLYCNCSKISDAKPFNEYLALKSFADAIGGEVYTNERNILIYEKLKNYADFLPYGKYQLRFKGVGELYIKQLLEEPIRSLADSNHKVKHHCRKNMFLTDEYFICKQCCPICSSSQRGCPLHCCTDCWKNLAIMSNINVNKIPILRIGKLSKKRTTELLNQLESVIKNNTDYKVKLKNRSVGYLHYTYDIVKFLYLTYEYNVDSIKPMIDALLRNA